MVNATHARAYLALLGVVLIAVGGVSVATPPPALTGVAQVVSMVLILAGVLGLALAGTFGPAGSSGLTDKQQAALTFISIFSSSLGAVNTAAFGLSGASLWYLQLIVMVMGAIGLALKEVLGTQKPTTAPAPAP